MADHFHLARYAIRTALLAVAVATVLPARADFEAGQRAWEAGRPGEALTQWQAAADAGDRRAMLALGRLYLKGLGVLQDYVEAHKWFNLAASRGETAALGERDALAEKMTPEERAEARKLARAWRPVASGTTRTPDASGAPRTTAAEPAPPPPSATPPPPPHAIREAQALLAALGYRPGPADGIWGERTGEAYRTFLGDAGMAAAGSLTPDALRAMRRIAARRDVTPSPASSAPSTRRTATVSGGDYPNAHGVDIHRRCHRTATIEIVAVR